MGSTVRLTLAQELVAKATFAIMKGSDSMVALLAVLADAGNGWDHMGGWGGGWMWLWGLPIMALFAVAIIWLVRATSGDPSTPRNTERSPTDRAREILAERYARGELSTEEYRERVDELR